MQRTDAVATCTMYEIIVFLKALLPCFTVREGQRMIGFASQGMREEKCYLMNLFLPLL